jgi:predicted dehydrogenase
MRATRLPTGAPEGYIEGFANIYREATRAICAEVNGEGTPQDLDFPTVEDGVKGMAFITAAVQSTKNGVSGRDYLELPSEDGSDENARPA